MTIPRGPAFARIEVKKSKFLAHALPVSSLDQVKEEVVKARQSHPDATHVVHAAVVGPHGSEFSLSDDGEPKGTSGRPCLEVLKGRGITNTAVLIVRYFGGTKLGTGGLVKAYGNAAKAVLDALETEPLVDKSRFSLTLSYQDHRRVKSLLEKEKVLVTHESFTEEVLLEGECPREVLERIEPLIGDLTRGGSVLIRQD